MALPSALKRRLEGDEPLSKRLKLAENAYCSRDLLINSKEDVILEWLCKCTSIDLVPWRSMHLCIDCQGSNSRIILHEKTKITLMDTLISRLKLSEKEKPLDDEIIRICELILSTVEMHNFFQSKLNKLCLFLKYLFTAIKSYRDEPTHTVVAQTCVLNGIETLVKLQKQHIDKDKLAESFLNYVLGPLCELIDPNCKDNSNRVGAESHKCIQQILFGKGRYPEYKKYFETKEGEDSLPYKLFRSVEKQKRGTGGKDAFNMILYVFRAAVGSYKTDSSLVDCLFREFVDLTGDLKTVVSNSLIECLSDIPLEYENKIGEISLNQFLGSLIEETLRTEEFTEKEYSLLCNIAALNPLVVENKLPVVFKRILLERRETEGEKESYVLLMMGILDASLRLRREQKLIPWVLLALHEALGENKKCDLSTQQILPVEFTSKFNKFSSGLNSSQIVAMLKSLSFHLKSNCVDEYGQGSRNHVSLMAECAVSLLVAFLGGIMIYEHTVPLLTKKKFVAALGQLGEVLSALKEKILNTEHDERMTVVLFGAVLSWIQIQSSLINYAPDSEAENLASPISDNDLERLIERVANFGDLDSKNALNNLLFYRISMNLDEREAQKMLPGIIGKLEDCWPIILGNYPELISLLDFAQLSEFSSLILKDVIDNNFERWQKYFEKDTSSENAKFNIAMLCQILMKIGSVMEGSASADITARINLSKILQNITNDAAVPALNSKRPIQDIVQLPNISEKDSSTIKKCLQTLLNIPLHSLSIPLRTMGFVTIYVVGRECKSAEGIEDLYEKILFETLEEGGLNVFDFIDIASLMPILPESEVLQKAFKISLRNADPSTSLEHLLTSLDSCPEEATPAVSSCIDNWKLKLNDEQKLTLCKVEKKLRKMVLSEIQKDMKFAKRIRGLTAALKSGIKRNKVKGDLKISIKSALRSIFVETFDADNDKENLTNQNENSNGKSELIKDGLELAIIALQHRARLDFPEGLVSDIWMTVLKYPDSRLLTPLLEASSPTVFNNVLETLRFQTEEELRGDDIAKLSNTLSIWNSIYLSDMGLARNKSRLKATYKLLRSLLTVDIHAEHWPDLIKLLSTIVKSRHIELSGEYIDMTISTGSRSLREGSLPECEEVLKLCLILLQSRIGMMTDRLPNFLQLYKQVIVLITREAKNDNTTNRNLLLLCASNTEKVTNALVKLKRDVLRLCPYMIADFMDVFAKADLQDSVKESFKRCLNSLLSICDSHGSSFLSRSLPPANREIFRGLNETYNKFHRFTGKI